MSTSMPTSMTETSATSGYKIKTLSEYQRSLERFEKFNDSLILPDMRLVVRIDARRFGKWGEDVDYPYDDGFSLSLFETAQKLMTVGFRVQLAVVHGDEISLLLDPRESANPRRRSCLLSLFSSAAAVLFGDLFRHQVIFHGVLSELPSDKHVLDYFFWQRKTFLRNLLSQVLHRRMTANGLSPREIDECTNPLNLEDRIKLAEELGYVLAEQADWKRNGAAVWWDVCNESLNGALNASSRMSSPMSSRMLLPGALTGEAACSLRAARSLPDDDASFLRFMQARLVGVGLLGIEQGCTGQVVDVDLMDNRAVDFAATVPFDKNYASNVACYDSSSNGGNDSDNYGRTSSNGRTSHFANRKLRLNLKVKNQSQFRPGR